MTNKREIYRCLEDVFHYKEFKSTVQKEAVNAVVNGKQDVFVSMPTGAGKSLVYQLPAVISHGVTLVVSPLLALMQDQVEALKALGICVATYNSNVRGNERLEIKCNLLMNTPAIKLLYVTPELLQTPEFNRILYQMNEKGNLAHVAVDEAHCVSQWGHDFRPAYTRLYLLKDRYPHVRWLALTATATPRVQQDTLQLLHFKEPVAVFKTGCYRPNLFYDVRFKELLDCPQEDLVDFVKSVVKDGRNHPPTNTNDCGIIYCHTKENCENMASKLSDSGIRTKAYHAGLNSKVRNDVQQDWMDGVISVIAATVSFGMGVDKSSVRFVVHWKIPSSVERYYQESGRAGRDGKKSYCRLYYSRYEREQILFLLRKDLKRKKGDVSIKERSSIESFKSLVEYCEEARCRHSFISKYFGDKKPECNKGCDFCRNRKEVELMVEHWRGGIVANKGRSKTYTCSDFGQANSSLYGGGRRGADARYSDDDDKEENYEEKCKKYRTKLVQDEFKKRRQQNCSKRRDSNEIENIPGLSCKIKDASNLAHIPKLSVAVREFCLGKIENALITNFEKNSRSTAFVEQLAANVEYGVFCANKSSQLYKLNIQNKVKEINQSTERGELFSVQNSDSQKVENNEKRLKEKEFKSSQFVKASELLDRGEAPKSEEKSGIEVSRERKFEGDQNLGIKIKEEKIKADDTSKIKIKQEPFEVVKDTSRTDIKEEKTDETVTSEIELIEEEELEPEEEPWIKEEQFELKDMDIECTTDWEPSDNDMEIKKIDALESSVSVVAVTCSSIHPSQGSASGDSPTSSVLETLKRPAISKDVQKIIAKREKHLSKSKCDVPPLPPLPPLSESYNKPDPPPRPCKKLEQKDALVPRVSSAQQNTAHVLQVTCSTVQPLVSSTVQSASSSGSQLCGTMPGTTLVNPHSQTYTTQSGRGYSMNAVNYVHSHNTQSFTPVFSLGTLTGGKTSTFQDVSFVNTSNYQSGSSATVSQPCSIHPELAAVEIASSQAMSPQFSFPYQVASYQGFQPTQESIPMDPRLYHGISQPSSGFVGTSSHKAHNCSSPSAPVNIVSRAQRGDPGFSGNINVAAKSSKVSLQTETPESSSKRSKTGEKPVKKDCADIIVKYLTPYYKSGEVESKQLFKSLAKEMTERLIQSMKGVPKDKLKNTARALVKMYFDEKRRKSSKVK